MLFISNHVAIREEELELQAIRAQGPGGQNVNKVSSAIHLRFDIRASSLPEFYKERLLNLNDYRVTKEGVIIIKSQEHKSQDMNRLAAKERLINLIREATKIQKTRRPTRPSRAAKARRMDSKTKRGSTKKMRGKVDY